MCVGLGDCLDTLVLVYVLVACARVFLVSGGVPSESLVREAGLKFDS